jgi:hypothetical protein
MAILASADESQMMLTGPAGIVCRDQAVEAHRGDFQRNGAHTFENRRRYPIVLKHWQFCLFPQPNFSCSAKWLEHASRVELLSRNDRFFASARYGLIWSNAETRY